MRQILRWLFDLLVRFARTLDLPLLGALLALMAIGLAVLYSAADHSLGLVVRQGAFFAAGLGVMWALSRIPPNQLRNWTPIVFAASLIPLMLVLLIGTGKHGRHWINLGVVYVQPAELLKLSLPMMVAWYLDRAGAAAAIAHGARIRGADRGADRADPAAARFRHGDAGGHERRLRAVPGRAAVVVVRDGVQAASPRSRRWRGCGCCARTRRTGS